MAGIQSSEQDSQLEKLEFPCLILESDLIDRMRQRQQQQLHQSKNQSNTMDEQQQQQGPHVGLEHTMEPRPESVRSDYKAAGKLQGKVALVTGGDSGIGRSVCYHYALEGAHVAFTYISPHEDVDAAETLHHLQSIYAHPHSDSAQNHIKIPVSDLGYADACKAVVEEVVAKYGRVDVLVNCAAEMHRVARIQDLDPAQLERTFRSNCFSQVYMIKYCVEHMRAGASIINTISRQAYAGNADTVDYAASKGAVVALTRSLARQLAEDGVRVNGVAPGPIWTPMNALAFGHDHDALTRLGRDGPMRRPGQPSEVGPAYVFLASQDASYFTGQFIHPNGGFAMYS